MLYILVAAIFLTFYATFWLASRGSSRSMICPERLFHLTSSRWQQLTTVTNISNTWWTKNKTVPWVEARNRFTIAPIFLLTQKGRPRRDNAVVLNCEKFAPSPSRHFFRLTVTWQWRGYGSVKFVSTWRCDLSRSKSMQSHLSCRLKVASINLGRFQYHLTWIDRHNIARVFTLIENTSEFMQFVRDKNWIKLRRHKSHA